MRGKDEQQLDVFSYISPEQRDPHDHPLRPLRVMTDEALREQPRFNKLYAKTGRPSIRAVAEGSASRDLQGGMGLHLCCSRLQLGPDEEFSDSSDVSRGCSVLAGPKPNPRGNSGYSQNHKITETGENLSREASFFRSLLDLRGRSYEFLVQGTQVKGGSDIHPHPHY